MNPSEFVSIFQGKHWNIPWLTNLPEEQLDDSLALLQQENHRQNEQRFNGMAPVVLAAAAAPWFFDVELGYMELSESV